MFPRPVCTLCAENGLGGTSTAFGTKDYGPHGGVIDTTNPFRVHAYFKPGASGALTNLEVRLHQTVSASRELRFTVADSPSHHANAGTAQWYVNQIAESMGYEGMTPVLEYRSAESMAKFDSPPCKYYTTDAGDEQDECGELTRFTDMAVTTGVVTSPLAPPPSPPRYEEKLWDFITSNALHQPRPPPNVPPSPLPHPPPSPPRHLPPVWKATTRWR